MFTRTTALKAFCLGCILGATATITQGQEIIWNVGRNDNTQATSGDGGGEFTTFWQENGNSNALPGNPANAEGNQVSDDDYYFAGIYDSIIAGNGDYVPLGNIEANEEGAERAFVPTDLNKRYHFNAPADLAPTNLLTVEFDFVTIDNGPAVNDRRFGVEVYVNGVKVQNEIIVGQNQLGTVYKSRQFTAEEVGMVAGPGTDNIVLLKGVPYNTALPGGGSWLGIDFVQLNKEAEPVPSPVFPLQIGRNDDAHLPGNGGGIDATFVRESGSSNALPGSPTSPETDGNADDDYYFAGAYTTVITANGDYSPVGVVAANEEAFERGLTPADPVRRIHFNLPNTMRPSDRMAVIFEPLDLEGVSGTVTDPRFGIEISVNGVIITTNRVVVPADLRKAISTRAFTLAEVNAAVGSGRDNIITIRGLPFTDTGGGGWVILDYVKIDPVVAPPAAPTLPWAVGIHDNLQAAGNGGAGNASFVQENGVTNPLPGDPRSPEVDLQADNDYYLGGVYSTLITGNGTYEPVGIISVSEEGFERALSTTDTEQRIHFNLPASVTAAAMLSVEYSIFAIDDTTTDPRIGVEVYVNNVKVQDEVIITPAEAKGTYTVTPFTAGSVNILGGEGFDNILTLRVKSHAAEGGSVWVSFDSIQMNPVLPAPFPWTVGRDDNNQPYGNGGGANASMVAETGGISALPGSPFSLERDRQSDNDYYFAGDYTSVIPEFTAANIDYTPVGHVTVNEEAIERAFAAGDNATRIHFNIPAGTNPTNMFLVSFDASSVDAGDANRIVPDPRYGVEIYVNDVLVMEQVLVRPADVTAGKDFFSIPFSLESVHAQVGPGFDNVVTLRGINYNNDTEIGSGGNWMGIDYIAMNALPQPVFPIQIGSDDNTHLTAGNGGGPNTSFVQENGTVNSLPGNPNNAEVNGQSDNDYYLAGVYTNVIASVAALYFDYTPIGNVVRNEESAERAFVPGNQDLRYHFNLPNTLKPTDKLTVTFDPLDFDTRAVEAPNPRWDVEVLFNGHVVGELRQLTPADRDTDITTPAFTLQSVDAVVGLGTDNIVSLRGTPYNTEGGGSWMGIDYVKVDIEQAVAPQLSLSNTGGNITISWTGGGRLQSASALATPGSASGWSDVAGAANGTYTTTTADAPKFYRVVNP